MKFYEIAEALRNCVDEETGEFDAEKYEAVQMEREKKLEGIALFCMELKADEAAVDAEIKRLTDKKNALKNKRESLRGVLTYQLNGEKLKTPLVSVTSRSTQSVVIDDVDALPAEFKEVATDIKVDKKSLLRAFGEWQSIAGAHLETKNSVTIR